MSKLGVGLIILVFFVYQANLVDMVDQLIKQKLQPQQWFCYSVISSFLCNSATVTAGVHGIVFGHQTEGKLTQHQR